MAEQFPNQLEFFDSTQIADPPLRDHQDAMIFPFLSLQKNRTKPIEYKSAKKGVAVRVSAHDGFYIASIWDWDMIIAISAILNDASERQLPATPRVRFAPHQVLKIMRRNTSGREYINLAHTVRRLQATRVETNIRVEDIQGGEGAFNWLSSYNIPKRYHRSEFITEDAPEGDPDPTKPWEVEFPSWLYKGLLSKRILAVHPAYFDLKGGIERWLYRVARKAVPDSEDMPIINYDSRALWRQSGLSGPHKEFLRRLRVIEAEQTLPEYGVHLSKVGDNTSVTLSRKYGNSARTRRGVISADRAVDLHHEHEAFTRKHGGHRR